MGSIHEKIFYETYSCVENRIAFPVPRLSVPVAPDDLLDDVDKHVLTHLQENARLTATELAERVGVSDNTIHNRMNKLESNGVIRGYHAHVDNDQVGLPLHVLFTCTADITKRSECAEDALDVPGVFNVIDVLSGEENMLIQALCAVDEDIVEVAKELNSIGLQIHDQSLVRSNHTQPVDIFDVER